MNKNNRNYLKIKIGVSGSAQDNCPPDTFDKAFELGQEVVKQGGILVNGATTGIPQKAAEGAKKAGGLVIGISPAVSKKEHTKVYKLPLSYCDLIIYTGMDYAGRNFLFIRSTDATIYLCGRIGTLNEFTIAFEDRKPIGILTGTGGTTAEIDDILRVAKRGKGKIVTDSDPRRLVKKVIEMIEKEQSSDQ
jgi:hypothetical protein